MSRESTDDGDESAFLRRYRDAAFFEVQKSHLLTVQDIDEADIVLANLF